MHGHISRVVTARWGLRTPRGTWACGGLCGVALWPSLGEGRERGLLARGVLGLGPTRVHAILVVKFALSQPERADGERGPQQPAAPPVLGEVAPGQTLARAAARGSSLCKTRLDSVPRPHFCP